MTDELGTNIEPEVTVQKAKKVTTPTGPKRTKIILEEGPDIPPTGLFVGHNGTGYLIKAGEPVDVPDFILEILDHAVMSSPQVDPDTKQIVGYRDRMKYPYRRV